MGLMKDELSVVNRCVMRMRMRMNRRQNGKDLLLGGHTSNDSSFQNRKERDFSFPTGELQYLLNHT